MNNFDYTLIKKFRKSKNLTQKDLATKVGVSSAYIQQLEKGIKTNPSLEVIIKLQQALDTQFPDLIDNSLEQEFISSHSIQTFPIKARTGIAVDSIKDELMTIINEEHNKSIAYIENLTNFYTHIESIKHNGAFSDIDDIETKIKETNIDNFKKVLNPSDLEIALKSLLLTDSINNFLEDPKDIEIQKQLQIVLDYFDVPQGKKLKLNLVDSE